MSNLELDREGWLIETAHTVTIEADRNGTRKTWNLTVTSQGVNKAGRLYRMIEWNGKIGKLSGVNGNLRLETMPGTRVTTVFTGGIEA